MAAINEHTRKMITTGINPTSDKYREEWERIFGKGGFAPVKPPGGDGPTCPDCGGQPETPEGGLCAACRRRRQT